MHTNTLQRTLRGGNNLCDSLAPRHSIWETIKMATAAIPWTLQDLWYIAYYMLNWIFSMSTCASVHASHLEVSSPPSHPCRHHFAQSSAEGSHIYLALAALQWLTALRPKKRVLCIHYQLYSTPTLWLRSRRESKTAGDIEERQDERRYGGK